MSMNLTIALVHDDLPALFRQQERESSEYEWSEDPERQRAGSEDLVPNRRVGNQRQNDEFCKYPPHNQRIGPPSELGYREMIRPASEDVGHLGQDDSGKGDGCCLLI